MSSFRVKPIDASLARRVRETLRDPVYGLPVRVEPATGYGPCRLCLNTFEPGEERILFLYNAFSADQEADVAGPIFIHAKACVPYGEPASFPEQIGRLPIVLRAYDRDRRCILESTPRNGAVEASVEALFESDRVAFVHVRNAEAKCFIACIERSPIIERQLNVLISSR